MRLYGLFIILFLFPLNIFAEDTDSYPTNPNPPSFYLDSDLNIIQIFANRADAPMGRPISSRDPIAEIKMIIECAQRILAIKKDLPHWDEYGVTKKVERLARQLHFLIRNRDIIERNKDAMIYREGAAIYHPVGDGETDAPKDPKHPGLSNGEDLAYFFLEAIYPVYNVFRMAKISPINGGLLNYLSAYARNDRVNRTFIAKMRKLGYMVGRDHRAYKPIPRSMRKVERMLSELIRGIAGRDSLQNGCAARLVNPDVRLY